jgi:peroxiredoxin
MSIDRAPAVLLLLLSALLPAARAGALGGSVAVGDAAPKITAQDWVNVDGPLGEKQLKDKVVLLEFWGTWCGPCVRSMPHVQKLHDRYRARGLVVVALTYEKPSAIRSFLKNNALTMPVACDPAKTSVADWGVTSWPATFVIDRAGKVAYAGAPYDVEPAIEGALGLEASPGSLLTQYFDALRAGDATKQRDALQRLYEKESTGFSLCDWGAERTGGKAKGKPAPGTDGTALLDRLAAAARSGKPEVEAPVLADLAAHGEDHFNLFRWVCAQYSAAFPLDGKELAELLAARNYEGALHVLVDRNPTAEARAAAVASDDLEHYCDSKSPELADLARRALMAELWVFPGRKIKDREEFFNELSSSAMMTSQDKKAVVGIELGGEFVFKDGAAEWVDRHLLLSLAAAAIADGKVAAPDVLATDAAAQRKKLTKELEAKY